MIQMVGAERTRNIDQKRWLV